MKIFFLTHCVELRIMIGNPVSVYALTQNPKMSINMEDTQAKNIENRGFWRNWTSPNFDCIQPLYLENYFPSGTAF